MKKRTHFLTLTLAVLVACNMQNNTDGLGDDGLDEGFRSPPHEYRPETWFHINGNNISREGITKDLEAIHYAGIRGIQLFNKNGDEYPGVTQVRILSPEWRDLIGHVASECERLGLSFTLQNCPGWSQTGGPWVPVEEAQRELVQTVARIEGGRYFDGNIPMNEEYMGKDYDYKDICVLAFPTPEGDVMAPCIPVSIESNNKGVPWDKIFDPHKSLKLPKQAFQNAVREHPELTIEKVGDSDTYVQVRFAEPVTLRSINIPPIRTMVVGNQYPRVDINLVIQTVDGGNLTTVAELPVPHSCWQDRRYDVTLALPEITTQELRVTFGGEHSLFLAHFFFQSQARIHNWEAQAAYTLRSLEQGITPTYASGCSVSPGSIIDLTDRMAPSGRLDWSVPEGNWTVVRFGHVNMRITNGPAVPEATGWECSKLDKIALENHLRNGMVGSLIEPGGPCGDGKLQGLLIDSWERMIPTWTIHRETLFEEFQRRRGYDLRPFMPAMMGYIIKDQSYTEKFLRDLRETMDDLFVENFFTHFRTVAHEFGTIVYTEGATGEVLPGDALRYYGVSDVPMTEFWYPRAPSAQVDGKPIKYATSASHLYNKNLVAAEACTEVPVTWDEHPFTVKYLIDKNFALGVNHLVFHTFSHTPQVEVYPGSSFGSFVGFPLVRNQTWWKHTPAWIEYLTRCQYMLQQGEYVADVLWYLGDELERPPFQTAPFPDGYQYDLLNPEILHTGLSVKNGMIKVKDGGEYRVIMLRNSKQMLSSTAEKISELVRAGAVILGDKPEQSPSLMDGPEDIASLEAISSELWGDGASGVKNVGKGKVYWGKSLEEVLQEEAIAKDVVMPEGLEIAWIHRQAAGADIYFLSSQHENALDASISFRTTGKMPEIWDPLNNEQKQSGAWQVRDGRTHVAISLPPQGSAFVVFRTATKSPSWTKVERDGQVLLDCSPGWYRVHDKNSPTTSCFVEPASLTAWESGEYKLTGSGGDQEILPVEVLTQSFNDSWKVTFEAGWDAPSAIELTELTSLTEHINPAVRYYSGTVTYRKEFQLSINGDKILLDLGDVANIAEVWCNGNHVGTRWSPPYIIDLTGIAQNGLNELEIRVTNTWRNQLVYDLQRPEGKKKTWTTNPPGDRDESPAPSGLIGPVVISAGIVTSTR